MSIDLIEFRLEFLSANMLGLFGIFLGVDLDSFNFNSSGFLSSRTFEWLSLDGSPKPSNEKSSFLLLIPSFYYYGSGF